MDGVEFRAIVEMKANFDEVLARKRMHFDQRSDPYHRGTTAQSDEPAA